MNKDEEELYAKFLPQFIPVARARVAAAMAATQQRDHAANMTIKRELHTLAGEAGLLGLRDMDPVIRDCESKAKQWDASGDARDLELLVAALRELERLVEGIAAGASTTR